MKRAVQAGLAALILSVGGSFAQTTTTTTTTETTGSLSFTPAQETTIRRYVTEHRTRPVTVRERVTVGATIPAEVELETLPSEIVTEVPAARSYRYFASDTGTIVVVDPGTRRVVRVISD